MFAPLVAKPKIKSADPQRSAIAAQRLGPTALAQRQLLQRTIGNQAMIRLLAERAGVASNAPGPVQAKLEVGSVNDPLEHQADRVADQVMRMPAPEVSVAAAPPQVSRKCAECQEEEKLQRKSDVPQAATGEAPAIVHEVLRSPGQSLDAATRGFFEPRFGQDLSRVRVHTGASAEQSAREVNAHAYTVGRSMVFDAGQFAPGTQEGRRLIAHELTHVLQQSGSDGMGRRSQASEPFPAASGATIRRQEKKPAPAGAGSVKKAPKGTAATAPKLTVTLSDNGPPCACLVVVHNNERNARKTAELMHANCSYNLALVEKDHRGRKITLPGHGEETDPNSLFPKNIVEMCLDNEKGCSDFWDAKSGTTTNKGEIEELVQIQFFLAISECSDRFSLPVVALHNNDTDDTATYRKQKDKKGVGDLKLDINKDIWPDADKDDKMDVNKDNKLDGPEQIAKLKQLIEKKFGTSGSIVKKEMMETDNTTNILRWCASSDLSHCHIGDPNHPDNVTWVTNEEDFKELSKKDINVVFQSEVPEAKPEAKSKAKPNAKSKEKPSESKDDLSTLFLLIRDTLNVRSTTDVAKLERRQQADRDKIDKALSKFDMVLPWIDILLNRVAARVTRAAAAARTEKLRFLNIEGPGKGLGALSDAERIQSHW